MHGVNSSLLAGKPHRARQIRPCESFVRRMPSQVEPVTWRRCSIREPRTLPRGAVSGNDVELWTGERLKHRQVARQGDFPFIPPGVAHDAVNRGTVPAVFVGVRNEPTAQESLAMRPELEGMVP